MATLRTYNGSNANHNFGAAIGIYFTVAAGQSLYVTDLGAFAAGGVGVPSGVTITVNLVNRSASSTLLAQTTFTNAAQGTVDATNRIMTKSVTPVTLGPGDYCVWAYGYGATYQAYNSTQPTPGTSPVTSTFGGAVTLGNDYYNNAGAITIPIQDGGTTKFGGATFIATAVSGNQDDETMTVNSNIEFAASALTAWTAATGTSAGDVVRLTLQGSGSAFYNVGTAPPSATVIGTPITDTSKVLTIGSGKTLYLRSAGAGVSVDIGTA